MSDMRQMTELGRSIEEGSFSIIDQEIGNHGLPLDRWEVVRRVIHSTADFDLFSRVGFSDTAIRGGIDSLRRGAPVLVDVRMIEVGLNADRLRHYGCSTHGFISDEDVIADAKAANTTRAIESMRKAHRLGLLDGAIVAIGNAPTALLEIIRLHETYGVTPGLVVGVPVGFVSAAESKEALELAKAIPSIVVRGRKGGSPIAVAILHALLVLARREEEAS